MSAYGAAAIGGGIGLIGSLASNYFASLREQQAREENYHYNELSAQNADARTRALYEDYQSPLALLRQYKEAGLSPSLMFANGAAGAGGMTQGAQGSGASGIAPTTYGAQLVEGAQFALMQAQARKLNAEADTIQGKNDRGKAELSELNERVKNIIENTNNVGLKNAILEYDGALKSIEVQEAASTIDARIETYIEELKYLKYKTRSALIKAQIDENTQKDVEEMIHENVRNVLADTMLKNAQRHLANEQKRGVTKQIELNDQQIKDLISQVENRGKNTDINRETLDQAIKEWQLKNGLIFNGEGNVTDYWQKVLFSEHAHDLYIQLFKALCNK